MPFCATLPPFKLALLAPASGAKVPPQVLVTLGGAATKISLGKLSVNAKPVSATLLGLLITSVSVEVLPAVIVLGENDLLIVGLITTFKVAVLLARPGPPVWVDDTPPEVLLYAPTIVLVTSKVMLQLPPAIKLPPVKLTKPVPASAVAVPPQLLISALGDATNKFVGKVSLNATLLKAMPALGLVIVSVKPVVPPTKIVGVANALLIVGLGITVNVLLAVLPVPTKGSVLETAPLVLR